MLPIQQKHIVYNFGNSGTKKLYIVIHDTGNHDKGANAMAHFDYFNGADREASASYFVDENNIIETVDPSMDAWHCGDGAGKYGITNRNSIGIETCVNVDGDYNKGVTNTLDLTVYLMKRFNIDLDHVVRHYDASRKQCPNDMSANDWAKWFAFKTRLAKLYNGGFAPAPVPAHTVLIKGSTGEAVVSLQNKLNSLGYNCGTPDGSFGDMTFNAVEAFQKAHGLVVDGEVGDATMSAINSAKVAPAVPKVQQGEVTAQILNIRSSASLNGAVIGTLKAGSKVTIGSKVGDFYSIAFGDHGGFAYAQYVKLI